VHSPWGYGVTGSRCFFWHSSMHTGGVVLIVIGGLLWLSGGVALAVGGISGAVQHNYFAPLFVMIGVGIFVFFYGIILVGNNSFKSNTASTTSSPRKAATANTIGYGSTGTTTAQMPSAPPPVQVYPRQNPPVALLPPAPHTAPEYLPQTPPTAQWPPAPQPAPAYPRQNPYADFNPSLPYQTTEHRVQNTVGAIVDVGPYYPSPLLPPPPPPTGPTIMCLPWHYPGASAPVEDGLPTSPWPEAIDVDTSQTMRVSVPPAYGDLNEEVDEDEAQCLPAQD